MWSCVQAWRKTTSPHLPTLILDRKSTRLNSSHGYISYAVFCLKKKNNKAVPPPSLHPFLTSAWPTPRPGLVQLHSPYPETAARRRLPRERASAFIHTAREHSHA